MSKIIYFKKTIKLFKTIKVFEPNLTTIALIEAFDKIKFKKKKKILDLGAGSGVIGIYIKKKYGKKINLFLSDKNQHTVKVIKSNLKLNNINAVTKESDILKSWDNEKFDIIINDISAISSEIAKSHWYNKFIPHNCGKDGIKLSKKFLINVKKNLNNNGIILIPIISLSDHKQLINLLKKKFKIKLLINKEWPAPKSLLKGKVANFLKKEYIFQKYNTYLCFTKVYRLQIKI
jgi:cyclopropane fatty-acyl-phospholipid synthase-like methyltransferase